MTAANIISFIRIFLIPVFMLAALIDFPGGKTIALVIFIVASITDGIDGYVAWKYNQITTLGKFLDPLADKLLVTAAILVFVQTGLMSAASAMIIITREFVVTLLRIVAMGESIVVAARLSGKINTVVQIIAIAVLLTPIGAYTLFDSGYTVVNAAVNIMVIVTVLSGIEYFRGLGKLLSIKKQ